MSVADSASADSPDLICVVCGDKANGMHYRALTCEGCKTFFRRNARHRDTLKCEMMNDGGCEMDMYTRRHCAACRMQKCISVGMQPDRLWDKNRLATRKPIKKKVKVKTEIVDKEQVPPEDSPTKAQDPHPELIEHHQEIGRLIALAYRSAKDTLPQPPANVTGIPEPASSDSSCVPNNLDESEKSHDKAPSKEATPHTSASTSVLPTKVSTPPKTPLSSDSPASTVTSPKLKVPQERSSTISPSIPSETTTATSPSSLTSSSLPLSKQVSVSPAVVGNAETELTPPKPTPVVKKCECGCVIHNKPNPEVQPDPMVEPSSAVDTTPSVDVLPKEVPPEDQPSTSAVKKPREGQRSMLAGGMKGQAIVPQIMEIVVLLLRHMINFAKQLPGFQSLTSDDQATLIKGALVEYIILTSCPLYDIETGQFNSEIWPTLSVDPDQVESAGFITLVGSVMSFAGKMHKLSLTEEELALLYALAIMSPDRRELEESVKVEELQQPLVDALQTCAQVNHPNKKGHFAKIIMLLTEVRNATEAYMDDLMSIQLSGNKLNPLLEELFNNGYCTRNTTLDSWEGSFDRMTWTPSVRQPHECLRECGTMNPMTCRYTFEIEWYSTMPRACYDCPCNQTDCERERCVTADGVRRPIVVANRQLPGPAIEVCLGDRIIVDVHNYLDDAEDVAIHWHGLLQKGTPYMDGASLITQCPIPAFSSFTYDFIADRVGTHWWHSHTGLQRSDGLFGAFIVRQPEEDNPHSALYDYDLPEHTMVISDWVHPPTIDIFVKEHHAGEETFPASILVNGKAQLAGYSDANGAAHSTPREIFEVEEGKSYRFRVISTTFSNIALRISVDSHNLTLISSDGANVKPLEVDALVIFGGERYDFVLNASQSGGGNYWMKIESERDRTANKGLAIIRYRNAVPSDPSADPSIKRQGVIFQPYNLPSSDDVIIVDQLVAIENGTLPQENKKTFYMSADFSQFNDARYWEDNYSPVVNYRAFTYTGYSLLSQFDVDGDDDDLCDFEDEELNQKCLTEPCSCTQYIHVDVNQTVELVVVDESILFTTVHPFHLHGHSFRVLAQGVTDAGLTLNDVIEMDRNGTIKRNLDNPPEKDTVIVMNPGYTVIQFVADNPGWWFFHCHFEFHLAHGMAIVIRVGNEADLPPVPDNFPRCGSFASSNSTTPTSPPSTQLPSPWDPTTTQFPLSTVVALAAVVGVLSLLVIMLLFVVFFQRQGKALTEPSKNKHEMKGQDAPWGDKLN